LVVDAAVVLTVVVVDAFIARVVGSTNTLVGALVIFIAFDTL
jgi:hypothetical protein